MEPIAFRTVTKLIVLFALLIPSTVYAAITFPQGFSLYDISGSTRQASPFTYVFSVIEK